MKIQPAWALAPLIATLLSAAAAQTIQLPSIHQFGVDTTVVVPDRGAVHLGGTQRAAAGSQQFSGVPGNRGVGIQRQAAGLSMTARVHDPAAAEAALAAQSQVRSGQKPPRSLGTAKTSAASARSPASAPAAAPLRSVAESQAQRQQQLAARQREAQALLNKAREARSAGKLAVAGIYLRTAHRQATGKLRQEIEAEQAR